VTHYQLHYAATDEAFRRLTRDGRQLDLGDFRTLLVQSGAIETGSSVDKDDEAGKVWREIADSQQFLPPTNVFVADGREGTSPPRRPGSLRFVCISDTHGRHLDLNGRLPAGDVLLHTGDFSMAGEMDEVVDFCTWFQSLPFKRKIVIAGNHDLTFDRSYNGDHGKSNTDADAVRQAFAGLCGGDDDSVVYLEDEEYCFQGIRIFGTPWQPEFGFWAFNLPRGEPLAEKWRGVPPGIDILLVHGPPLGRGDAVVPSMKRTGCADLLQAVQARIRPAYVVCGHVHEGAGVTFDGTTHFINASSLNEHYECIHPPLIFDVPIPSERLDG
jgi:hypothetical protein